MAARATGAQRQAAASRRSSARSERVTTGVTRGAEVVLDVEVEHGLVHLVLANCGDAAATSIRVEFSRRLLGLDGTLDLSELPVFKRLGVLRPGRTLRVFWDTAASLLMRDDRAAPFTAAVSWDERARHRQRADYQHDLSIYRTWPESIDPSR
jgi:hypothetical protein